MSDVPEDVAALAVRIVSVVRQSKLDSSAIEPILVAFAERVREPLEKERDEAIGANILNRNVVARLKAELASSDEAIDCRGGAKCKFDDIMEQCWEHYDRDLRAQLSEARADLETLRLSEDCGAPPREPCKLAPTWCSLHAMLRDQLALAEAQQRVLELENFAIEENHAIMTLTGIPRGGYSLQQEIRAQLEEAQRRLERLTGALREIATAGTLRDPLHFMLGVAEAALSEEPATGVEE